MLTIQIFEMSRNPAAATAVNRNDLYARQQFEAGLQWLKSRGVHVERHAISLDGPLPIDNPTLKTAIELQREDSLPIIVLDGSIISIGGYPARSELMISAGYKTSDDPGFLQEVSDLEASMRATLAGNNTTMFLLYCEQALSLGLPAAHLRKIIEAAKNTCRGAIRDETLTMVEQFLAFGATGKPKAPRCSCNGRDSQSAV